MSVSDADLLRLLSGALDPGRAARVREALQASPDLRARFALLSETLRAAEGPPRWALPAPGAASGLAVRATELPVMGKLAPLGTFTLRLPVLPDADQRVVVVLRGAGDAWLPVAPTSTDQAFRLSDCDREGDAYLLLLTAGPDAGTQRFAVALPPDEGQDWADPTTWRELSEAVAFGEVPAATTEIEVG